MNTIGYHSISNTVRTAYFMDITEILPIRVINSDKVAMYQLELQGIVYDVGTCEMKTHIGLCKEDDYVEFEGTHYSYAEMDRLIMVWENLQNQKTLDML